MTTRSSKINFVPNNNIINRLTSNKKIELRRCTKCLMVETNETIEFDTNGVCNICNSFENRASWNEKEKISLLNNICNSYKGRFKYDAIVPFSGGKDSAYVAYYLVKKLGLKILLANFDSHFRRPLHLRNIDRLVRELGCDIVTFRASEKVIKKTMLEAFRRKGDFCWYCHTGVCAYPLKVAIQYNIPLIIWGEPNSEYAVYTKYEINERRTGEEPEGTERAFNRIMNLGINAQDMNGFLDDIDERDLEPFKFPEESELENLRNLGLKNICLGDYIIWDPIKQIEILEKELGWTSAPVEGLDPMYKGEKVECFLQGLRDHLRYVKRGYSRTNQRANAEIRRGKISREEGLQQENIDSKVPASMEILINYLGIDKDEFYEIAKFHSISPWIYNSNENSANIGEKLPDHDYWYRELMRLNKK